MLFSLKFLNKTLTPSDRCVLSMLPSTSLQDFEPGKPADECKAALCTSNLHTLVCQLTAQVKYKGHTAYFLELWVERAMGWAKQNSKYRMHSVPEKQAVARALEFSSAERMALELGVKDTEEDNGEGGGDAGQQGTVLQSWRLQVKKYSSSIGISDGGEDAASWQAAGTLRGKGTLLTEEEWEDWQVSKVGLGRAGCIDQANCYSAMNPLPLCALEAMHCHSLVSSVPFGEDNCKHALIEEPSKQPAPGLAVCLWLAVCMLLYPTYLTYASSRALLRLHCAGDNPNCHACQQHLGPRVGSRLAAAAPIHHEAPNSCSPLWHRGPQLGVWQEQV